MSSAPEAPLGAVHTPLRQAVTDAIRERIVDGTYPAGSRLLEESVAGELAVSRNPVREAFQLLANEGFVEIEPRRGARVAAVDERQASEIFEVRAVLEGLVAARAARRVTPRTAAELDDIVTAGARAAERRELGVLPMLNTRFHGQLAAMSDNDLLTSMLDQLSGLIRWIYAERLESRVLNSWHEHTQLSAAVATGDEERARRLAIEHVQSARQAFMNDDGDA
jgi:DNA-binding GntR family transcriptional regulator